jgi:holin (3TMs family)
MASAIANILGGGALKGAADIINAIKGHSPEDAAKLQELVTKHQDLLAQLDVEREKNRYDADVRMNDIAGQNIRAEQNSRFSAWARPGVIWGGLFILMWNYCVLVTLPPRWGYKPFDFPSLFWEIWGICVTGYVFARTADKLFGGEGGSMQLPFGIKMESKGDQK